MATSNAVNLKDQGVAYVSSTGTFSGIDGSTAGKVLTSNGTGIAPSFQSPASSLDPLTNLRLIDDFCTNGYNQGQLFWSANYNLAPAEFGHPGIFLWNSGPFYLAGYYTNGAWILLSSGIVRNTWVVALTLLSSNTYDLNIGMTDEASYSYNAPVTDGLFFSYSDLVYSGNWVANIYDSLTSTIISQDTGVPATTNFVKLQIVSTPGVDVKFYINGVLTNTIVSTTTQTLVPVCNYRGTLSDVKMDLFVFEQDLSVSR